MSQDKNHSRENNFWFAPVDVSVLTDKTLSSFDKAVFGVLCAHANRQTRKCWPKVKTIAEEAGCSVRTVHASLKTLEERGIIAHVQRVSGNRKISSVYWIIGHDAECYSDGICTECMTNMQEAQIENESQENIESKDILTGGARLPGCVELPNETPNPETASESEPESKPGHDSDLESIPEPRHDPKPEKTLLVKAGNSFGLNDIPEIMRPTAEYLMFKTGRRTLRENELSVLRELSATQFPARVQKEIDTACERFRRMGRRLDSLTFGYIADSLRNQPTYSKKSKSKQAAKKPNPMSLTSEEIARTQVNYTDEDMKRIEEMMRLRDEAEGIVSWEVLS